MASPVDITEESHSIQDKVNDLIARNTKYINSFNYKIVQNMASERKLPANLRKFEMARLIALHDAGAEEELEQLMKEFKDSRRRSRKRRLSYAVHQGSGTTTAEADSASASPPNLDADDNLRSPLNDDPGDGDEDYEPHGSSRKASELNPRARAKKPRSSKGAASGKQARHSSYDAAAQASPLVAPSRAQSLPAPELAALPGPSGSQGAGLALSPVVAAGAASALGAPSAVQAMLAPPADKPGSAAVPVVGILEQELARPSRKPAYRRPAGSSAAANGARGRVNKTSWVAKAPRDASYLYSNQMTPSLPPPYVMATSPSLSTERGGYETSLQLCSSAFRAPAPYGHAIHPSMSSIGRAGFHQPWMFSEKKTVSSHFNPSKSTHASLMKQFVSQPTQQNAPKRSPYAYPQPDFNAKSPQYTSKTSPDSSSQALPNQHQMLNVDSPNQSVDFNLSPINQEQLNYHNYKPEKSTDYTCHTNSEGSYTNIYQSNSTCAVLSVDSPYTLSSFTGSYDDAFQVSQTTLAGQVASESLTHPQVLRPTPVAALPVNDISSGHVAGNLELLLNVRSDQLLMPEPLRPYWKPANTNSVNSYAPPIVFASSSGPGLYQGSSHTQIEPYVPGMSVMPSYGNTVYGPFTSATNMYQQSPLYENNSFGIGCNHSQLSLPQLLGDGQKKSFSLDPVTPCHSLSQHEVPHQLYGVQSKFPGAQPHAQGSTLQQCLSDESSLNQCSNSFMQQSTQVISEPHQQPGSWPPQHKVCAFQAQSKHRHPQQLQRQEDSWRREKEEQKYLQQKLLVQQKRQLFFQQQQQNKVQLAKQFGTAPDKKQGFYQSNVSCELLQPSSPVNKEIGNGNASSLPTLETIPLLKPGKPTLAPQLSSGIHHSALNHELGSVAKKSCYSSNGLQKQEPVNQTLVEKESSPFLSDKSNLLSSPSKPQLLPDTPQLDFPEFRGRNNQLSQQLIYDYLTSAEKQLTSIPSGHETHLSNSIEQDTEKQFPTEAKVSQSCYEINNSLIDDILPTLAKHLVSQKLQTSGDSKVSGEKLNDPNCEEGTPDSLSVDVSHSDTLVGMHKTTETKGSMEELPDESNPQPMEGVPTEPEGSDLQSISMGGEKENSENIPTASNHPVVTQANSCYVELLPVPVESISYGEMPEERHDLIPLRAVQADNETCVSSPFKSDNVLTTPLTNNTDGKKMLKEDESAKQAIFLCSNTSGEFEYMTLNVSQDKVLQNSTNDNLSVSGTLLTTTSLLKDVVKDINMNEVSPIQSLSEDNVEDANGEDLRLTRVPSMVIKPEFKVEEIPLSQNDSVGIEVNLNQDVPLTPILTEDGNDDVSERVLVNIGSELDEEDMPLTQRLSDDISSNSINEEDSEEGQQFSESVLNTSQVSTIPATSMEASTFTATSGLTDYLSSSTDMTEGQCSETQECQVPSEFGCNVRIFKRTNASRVVPTDFKNIAGVSETDITMRKVPSSFSVSESSNSVDTQKDEDMEVMTSIKEETQELMEPDLKFSESTSNLVVPKIYETNCDVGNPGLVKIEIGPGPRDVPCTLDDKGSEENKVFGISKEKLLDCSHESNNQASDVNLNIMKQINFECSVVLKQVTEPEEQEHPGYLVTESKAQHDAPLIRSKSAGKTCPGKQVLQPVRSSPRTSGRAGPSYNPQSSTLQLSRSASPRLESAMQQTAKGRKSCLNVELGCVQILPPAQLSSHLLVCEFTRLECPAIGCEWHGIAKKLSVHIRDAHRALIGAGTDSTHTVSVQEIHQQQLLTFLREVSRKLFVICIHSFENSIYASMQYVAPGRTEKPVIACGTIEVVDKTGRSHAWRGKIGPIQQHLTAIRATGNCLQVTPESIGSIFDDSIITFHTNIRVSQSASSQQ